MALDAAGVGVSLEPQLGLSVATAVTFLLQERHLPEYGCSRAFPISFFACFVSCCILQLRNIDSAISALGK